MTLADAAVAVSLHCAPADRVGRGGETRKVMRCETDRAVVDYDLEGLSASDQEAFARLADRGIRDLEPLVSGTSGESAPRSRTPVRYVVSARVDMSRTFGRTVLLPLSRVRDRAAPYLHETVHALLPTKSRSTWLTEGLACYLESWVAENKGGYDAHVFTSAGDRRIHDAARLQALSEAGRAVLPWVGAPGEPPKLFEDRRGVARPFYVLSHSFTKYLVEKLGLPAVVDLAREAEPETALRRLTGREATAWRTEWLSAAVRSG